ncbi:Pycsar system effector family protein [Streptomyces albus]
MRPGARRPGHAVADRLLQDMRGEIARADSKAAVLLGAVSMTVGAFAGVLAGSDWSPSQLPCPGAAAWWTGVGALGIALLALLMAVLPRYGRSAWAPGMPLTYFADIRTAASRDQLRAALADTERATLDAFAASLAATSRIVHDKHRWIRAGVAALCAGLPLLCVPVLTR